MTHDLGYHLRLQFNLFKIVNLFKNAVGLNMSLKIYFLYSHLDYILLNLGAENDEQGEHFH